MLAEESLVAVAASLRRFSAGEVINPLFSALCAPSEMVRWHAVSAFGWVVPEIATEELEAARVVMRRFLWSLNDESGGIGWGAPEALAEIMAHDERLCEEYLHMLLSYCREDGPELFQDGNFLELPMLQRGLLWGLGRMCRARKQRMVDAGIVVDVVPYLQSPDGSVRGLAVWVLQSLDDHAPRAAVENLADDPAEVTIYWQGTLRHTTVAALVRDYLHGTGS